MCSITEMVLILICANTLSASTMEGSLDLQVSTYSAMTDQLDFLYNEILTKSLVPPNEIMKAFCLDCNLGQKYDDLIISSLKIIFENPSSKFLFSIFLQTVVQTLNNPKFFANKSKTKIMIYNIAEKDLFMKPKLEYIFFVLCQALTELEYDRVFVFEKFNVLIKKKDSTTGNSVSDDACFVDVEVLKGKVKASLKKNMGNINTIANALESPFKFLNNNVIFKKLYVQLLNDMLNNYLTDIIIQLNFLSEKAEKMYSLYNFFCGSTKK